MDKKIIVIATIIVVLLAVAGLAGYFYWNSLKKAEAKKTLENISGTAEQITNSANQGVLPSLQTNPLEAKPDVNPADKANPFKDIKTNPF